MKKDMVKNFIMILFHRGLRPALWPVILLSCILSGLSVPDRWMLDSRRDVHGGDSAIFCRAQIAFVCQLRH
jgi:hypothetical protein